MPLGFGMAVSRKTRRVIQAYIVMYLASSQFYHLLVLYKCQESVLMGRLTNVTTIEMTSSSLIPYEDCRCSIRSTKECLTDHQLKYTRLILVVLFFCEVYLIREVIRTHRNHVSFFINAYWIVSMLIFVWIVFIIYRSSYYYSCTAGILSWVGLSLFLYCSH